jgi:hypothetical protein
MYRINEDMSYASMYSNEDIIEALGEIPVFDSGKRAFVNVKAGDIIKVCNDALYRLDRDYKYLYQFLTKCKLMYIPVYPSQICDTMCVDSDCNLWINLTFVYDDCEMSTDRVFGILFHELFHIFFDHLLRFQKVYPKEMFATSGPEVYKQANKKANLCMDYEVNASMVEDGIVSADFWKVMNGLYKKEYTGMTWEEILKNYGDAEYNDWLTRNGESLDTKEKQILDAIEKASKVLLDPDADEDDKREARKELQKDLDKILGKEKREESTLQDELEDLAKTKLGDHGEIAMDLEDLADDLDKDPSKMSDKEFDKVMSDIDKAMDEIIENADEVGDDFGKSGEDVVNDANKARKEMKDAMQRMKEGGLSKEEKSDLMDKMKDALEDVISNDVEKEKSKKKREERDAAKEADRLEKFKKSHPIRKIIIILKNLADLHEIDLISEKTYNTLNRCIDELEPLTEKKFSDIKKSNLRGISDALDQLKEDLLPDLVELINNETILTKTEDDMKKFLDDIFEKVFDAFRRIFDPALDDEQKGALMKLAAQRLRAIGKMLKTQKKWRVGDDFKEAYKAEIKRLMEIQKTGGDEALMKELLDLGVINPLSLDEHGEEVYKAVTGKSSKFDDLFDMIGRMCDDKKDEISDEEVVDGLVDTLETEGASEDDLEKAREALTKLFKGEL